MDDVLTLGETKKILAMSIVIFVREKADMSQSAEDDPRILLPFTKRMEEKLDHCCS